MCKILINTRLISKIRVDHVGMKNQLSEKNVLAVSNIYFIRFILQCSHHNFLSPSDTVKNVLKAPTLPPPPHKIPPPGN